FSSTAYFSGRRVAGERWSKRRIVMLEISTRAAKASGVKFCWFRYRFRSATVRNMSLLTIVDFSRGRGFWQRFRATRGADFFLSRRGGPFRLPIRTSRVTPSSRLPRKIKGQAPESDEGL